MYFLLKTHSTNKLNVNVIKKNVVLFWTDILHQFLAIMMYNLLHRVVFVLGVLNECCILLGDRN